MKELDEKIREYVKDKKLDSKKSSNILSNKTAVDLYLGLHGVKNVANLTPELLGNACMFGLYSNTFKFNEAKQKYDYDDSAEFFDEVWNKDVEVVCKQTTLKIKMVDLVLVCESNGFLDRRCSSTANDFVAGNFLQDDFMSLLEEIEMQGINKDVSDARVTTDLEKIFDTIISAEELREGLCNKAVDKEFEKLSKHAFTLLDEQVFKGACTCFVTTKEKNKTIVDGIVKKFKDLHFLVSAVEEDDCTKITLSGAPTNGDYTGEYSEDDLIKLLNAHDGGVYYFVKNYCEKVYLPRLITEIVSDVTSKLKSATLDTGSVRVEKRKTKTDAYLLLFNILSAKQFIVNDFKEYYEVKFI